MSNYLIDQLLEQSNPKSTDKTAVSNLVSGLSNSVIQSVLPQNTSSYETLEELLMGRSTITKLERVEFYKSYDNFITTLGIDEDLKSNVHHLDGLKAIYLDPFSSAVGSAIYGKHSVVSDTGEAILLHFIDEAHNQVYGNNSGITSLSESDVLTNSMLVELGFEVTAYMPSFGEYLL